MTYIEFVCNEIENIQTGIPIYTKNIAKAIATKYAMNEDKASLATAVAFKRIMDGNIIPQLRFYQKGIYYKTIITPFGEININKDRLIADKYILPNIGYETGPSLMYHIGLTTQMPNERTIATNVAREYTREDKNLGVIIKPPKVKITAQNKDYLQTLDILDWIDKTPVDEQEPYLIIAKHIKEKNLQYKELLVFASNYYNKNTILRIADVAKERNLE